MKPIIFDISIDSSTLSVSSYSFLYLLQVIEGNNFFFENV